MSGAVALLNELRARDVRIERRPTGKLRLSPARAVDADLLDRVRAHKPELLALLDDTETQRGAERNPTDRASGSDYEPAPEDKPPRDRQVNPAVRVEIERWAEYMASHGWPHERIWGATFWPIEARGLAAVMNPGDRVAEVTAEYIVILRTRRDLLRFRRRTG